MPAVSRKTVASQTTEWTMSLPLTTAQAAVSILSASSQKTMSTRSIQAASAGCSPLEVESEIGSMCRQSTGQTLTQVEQPMHIV